MAVRKFFVAGLILVFFGAFCFLYERRWPGQLIAVVSFWWLCSFCFFFSRRIFFSIGLSVLWIVFLQIAGFWKRYYFGENIHFVDLLLADFHGILFFIQIYPLVIIVSAVFLSLIAYSFVKIYKYERPYGFRLVSLFSLVICSFLIASFSNTYSENRAGVSDEYIGLGDRRFQLSFFVRSVANSYWRILKNPIDLPLAEIDEKPFEDDDISLHSNKFPHVLFILDESGFDMRSAISDQRSAAYFTSFDGTRKALGVEAFGAPTTYSEYSIISGLSSRSFGAMRPFFSRIHKNNFNYSLSKSLSKFGYKSQALYPFNGSFQNASETYTSLGFGNFFDKRDMQAPHEIMRDAFYYDNALAKLQGPIRTGTPTFTYIVTMINHFPWMTRFEPDNPIEVDSESEDVEIKEYLRRQAMSMADYDVFLQNLKKNFPDQPFLIVKFGDHQPFLARRVLGRDMTRAEQNRRIANFEAPFYNTYFSVHAINFTPKALPDFESIDVPYLGALTAYTAGLPLDKVQKLQMDTLFRCKGVFYSCENGEAARIFNHYMIKWGFIKGL